MDEYDDVENDDLGNGKIRDTTSDRIDSYAFDDDSDYDDSDDGVDIVDEQLHELQKKMIDDDSLEKKEREAVTEWVHGLEELHNKYKRIQKAEIESRDMAKRLKMHLDDENSKLKEISKDRQSRAIDIAELRKQALKVEQQYQLSQEQDSELNMTIIDKERQIAKLEAEVIKNKQAREEREQPAIDEYTKAIKRLEIDQAETKKKIEKFSLERQNVLSKIVEVEDSIHTYHGEFHRLKEIYEAEKGEPSRFTLQTSIVTKAYLTTNEELQQKRKEIASMEEEIKDLKEEQEEILNTAVSMRKLETHEMKKLISVENDVKRFKTEYLKEVDNFELLQGKTAALEHELNHAKRMFQMQQEILRKKTKEEESIIKSIKARRKHYGLVTKNLNETNKKKAELHEKVDERKEILLEGQKRTNAVHQDVEILLHRFLMDESTNKEILDKIKRNNKENQELEIEVQQLEKQERLTQKKMKHLGIERENLATEASKAKKQFIDMMGEMQTVSFVINELRKQLTEMEKHNHIIQETSGKLKRDRNKYAKAIQTNQELLEQIIENKKVLDSEHEVLTKLSIKKDKLLLKTRREHEQNFHNRESLRAKYSAHEIQLKKLRDQISEAKNEIAKLTAITNVTETEMLNLKKEFEDKMQEKNQMGSQLMDRHDELAILYEKANVQSNIIQKGETEMKIREKEYKVLETQLKDVQREVSLMHRALPEIKAYKKEKETLMQQINHAREIAEQYGKELENPMNEDRYRKLLGEDLDEDVLDGELLQITQKLEMKQRQLKEKQLIANDITASSDRLRQLAVKGRDQTYDISVAVNELQAQIREQNRALMANLSELSIYQASNMTLDAQNQQIQIHIDECRNRIAQGKPPSDEMIWQYEKEKQLHQRRKEQIQHRKQMMESMKELPATITRTTAAQRPTSYIPEVGIGIPKPYLVKPVMPSGPSAQMRHYRKPEKVSIVL